MERPDIREKLFRSFAKTHHEEYYIPVITMNIDGLPDNEMDIAWSLYDKTVFYVL